MNFNQDNAATVNHAALRRQLTAHFIGASYLFSEEQNGDACEQYKDSDGGAVVFTRRQPADSKTR